MANYPNDLRRARLVFRRVIFIYLVFYRFRIKKKNNKHQIRIGGSSSVIPPSFETDHSFSSDVAPKRDNDGHEVRGVYICIYCIDVKRRTRLENSLLHVRNMKNVFSFSDLFTKNIYDTYVNTRCVRGLGTQCETREQKERNTQMRT